MTAGAFRRVTLILAVAVLAAPARQARSQFASPPTTLDPLLSAVGRYVEDYLARVQTIISTEKVTVQPLARDLSGDGHTRTYLYELRLDPGTDPDGAAAVRVRDLVRVDGRAPKQNDLTACLDQLEPLEFLRPDKQREFQFVSAGVTRIDGRRVEMIDFRGRVPGPVAVTWNEHCGRVELPGRTRGRVWVDPESATVLRLDEGMTGIVDLPVPRAQQPRLLAQSLVLERADTQVRYRPVRFSDPDETLFLPERIETVTVIRNGTSPRVRTRHEYTNYRRFVTGGRILP